MIKNYISGFINLFYPNYCLFDGKKIKSTHGSYICEPCFNSIKFISLPLCSKCGNPMHKEKGDCDAAKTINFLCKRCTKSKNWFRFLRSACSYEGVIKKCIHLFKYRKKTALRKLFADILHRAYKLHFAQESHDLITAVPMHTFKKFLREFNHAEILATDISLNCKIEFLKKGFKRIKLTKTQTLLNSQERKNNVKNAFAFTKPHKIQGKKILLIDDVATTLSTVNECAKSLLSNGAKFVDVLTIARG